MTTTLDDYIAAAKAFIASLDPTTSSEPQSRIAISQALASLYGVAVALPEVEPTSSSTLPERHAAPLDPDAVPREVSLYWTVDGLLKSADTSPEPIMGYLYDDLADIRRDVLAILDCIDEVEPTDLVWQARFDFETHWSWHALDALRALHPSR